MYLVLLIIQGRKYNRRTLKTINSLQKKNVVLYVKAITITCILYRKAKNFIAFSLRTDNIDPFTDMLSTYKEGFINLYIIHTRIILCFCGTCFLIVAFFPSCFYDGVYGQFVD